MYNCEECKREFKNSQALNSHKRSHREGSYKKGVISRKINIFNQKMIEQKQYESNPKICPECGENISWFKRNNKFCSSSCRATYTNERRTTKTYELSKEGLANILRSNDRNKIFRGEYCKFSVCQDCGEMIQNFHRLRCDKCYKIHNRKNGGYKKGSGNSKGGWFKGYYLDSTYELAYLIWALDHHIPIVRFKGSIPYENSNGEERQYIPDFLVDGKILEIKGYHQPDVDLKKKAAEKEGYKVQVLYKEDLTEQFEHVTIKYNTKDFKLLYEDKKWFESDCKICGLKFKRSKPIKDTQGCCRSHSVMIVRRVQKWSSKK